MNQKRLNFRISLTVMIRSFLNKKNKMKGDQYFKIRKERQDYKGIRYFRFNYDTEKVVQVCSFTGDVKKGKSNTFGVYLIHRLTFFTNYLAINYCEPCTKREFEKAFEKTVKMLK